MEIPTLKKNSVIGPGMAGHAIAQEFAVGGYEVILYGRTEESLKQALTKFSAVQTSSRILLIISSYS